MDLGMLTYSWLMTVFLTQVQLSAGVRVLDAFFLDGPAFLYWMALAILKMNEEEPKKARDEEKASRILKGFFESLGCDEDNVTSTGSPDEVSGAVQATLELEDLSTASRKQPSPSTPFEQMLTIAYGQFSHVVTLVVIEDLRNKSRLTVVHKMDDSSEKSRTRDLQEMFTSFKLDEVTAIFDELATAKSSNPTADVRSEQAAHPDEDRLLESASIRGGWGLPAPGPFHARLDVPLRTFPAVFSKLSPWRSVEQPLSSPTTSLFSQAAVYSRSGVGSAQRRAGFRCRRQAAPF
ncbi:hypothetical protein M427DRAFT_327776 [Gonapodya prolifera JEL478]|uniref:Rab-GAP TBC domain-containing protein n=1 Tax=Gonapodya prolifera (strain JEL478) TaxID=1344416 RepID=A0A139AEV2_GONPJ|nr:hypothetical protein M427DRAFT_327776 [Gonapodya prolifera JEL478]|eukprot:KXS15331.1 hypothetical protein M427DRAFT_327776 [Gonapodya prolifera JEL478]